MNTYAQALQRFTQTTTVTALNTRSLGLVHGGRRVEIIANGLHLPFSVSRLSLQDLVQKSLQNKKDSNGFDNSPPESR